jgi:hypothetical protein
MALVMLELMCQQCWRGYSKAYEQELIVELGWAYLSEEYRRRPLCVYASNSLSAPYVAVRLFVFSHLCYLQTASPACLSIVCVNKRRR